MEPADVKIFIEHVDVLLQRAFHLWSNVPSVIHDTLVHIQGRVEVCSNGDKLDATFKASYEDFNCGIAAYVKVTDLQRHSAAYEELGCTMEEREKTDNPPSLILRATQALESAKELSSSVMSKLDA